MDMDQGAGADPAEHRRHGARAASGEGLASFAREGYAGPFPLYTRAQCALIADYERQTRHPNTLDWPKGRAAADRLFYDLASHPTLIALLRPLLGEDILLWGASVVQRAAGRVHPWHVDIESAAPGRRFVSIWIGIENTGGDSGLQLISRSHSFAEPIQQVQQENGRQRGEATEDEVLAWARERDPAAALVQTDCADGQAILFDGRIWHGSRNSGDRSRLALLFQYAAADAPVLMPDPKQIGWPFRLPGGPAPCLVVSGRGREDINRLVPAPPYDRREQPVVCSRIRQFALPLQSEPGSAWQAFPCLRGPTPLLDSMRCHISVLQPGHMPHPPHAHEDEELLLMIEGSGELLIGASPDVERARVEPLRPGSFVYYPAFQHHTIRNASEAPIAYLMFRWRGASRDEGGLGTRVVHYGDAVPRNPHRSMRTCKLFTEPTAYLAAFHAHLTELDPGAGYEPHVDPYDVAVLMLSGTIETIGQVVEPFGVIYYPAGEPHGMKNVGDTVARYLVFEFHAPRSDASEASDFARTPRVARAERSRPRRFLALNQQEGAHLIGASIPCSGQDFLSRILRAYYPHEMHHCGYYQENCCRSVPCTRSAGKPVVFHKHHDRDFTLAQDLPNVLYVVQYREPVSAALSDLELHLKRCEQEGRPPCTATRRRFTRWLAQKAQYYTLFHDKWVEPARQNAVLIDHANLLADPTSTVVALLSLFDGAASRERLAQAVASVAGAGAEAGAPYRPGVFEENPFFDRTLFSAFESLVLDRCPAYRFKRSLGEANYREHDLYAEYRERSYRKTDLDFRSIAVAPPVFARRDPGHFASGQPEIASSTVTIGACTPRGSPA
jgi:quercetin dioxygenase-like cupin family protein